MEVIKYKELNDGGPIIAFVDFKIPEWGLNLCDCKLIKTKDGRNFVGFPGKKYEKDGETKYAPYFWFDKEVSGRFQKSAKEAINKYVMQN